MLCIIIRFDQDLRSALSLVFFSNDILPLEWQGRSYII